MDMISKSEPWYSINYREVYDHYYERYKIHQRLINTFQKSEVSEYVELALGISEGGGNYSASEHGLGPQILQQSPPQRIFELAQKLFICKGPLEIPDVIYNANIPYLKISVGSEMATLLRPDSFWITNVRTIWAYFVLKHNNSIDIANDQLFYYRTREMPSEMEYQLWKEIHPLVGPSMEKLAHMGSKLAKERNIESGNLKYLWADAIADTAYNEYSK